MNSDGGRTDTLPNTEGWSKPMKLAQWRSPLRSSGGTNDDHGSKLGGGGRFGPLDVGPITMDLGEVAFDVGREGAVDFDHSKRTRSPTSQVGRGGTQATSSQSHTARPIKRLDRKSKVLVKGHHAMKKKLEMMGSNCQEGFVFTLHSRRPRGTSYCTMIGGFARK